MTTIAPPSAGTGRSSREWSKFSLILVVFGAAWFLPIGSDRFFGAIQESLALAHWYAREHVLVCLIPAFFIAGAVSVFISQGAVLKYLGPQAPLALAYPVGAVSGGILAVCSCTVLPLFASIHQRGAGLGPATAFLYSGPAINVLAIILTARVLGPGLGIARAVGAITFAIVIGLLMQTIFAKEERARQSTGPVVLPDDTRPRTLGQEGIYFLAMVGILVFANWGRPEEGATGIWALVYSARWFITAGFALLLLYAIFQWFERREMRPWVDASWGFAKLILPLLLIGVLVAGFLLGGPGGSDRGIIPSSWVESAVGGNSLGANLFASVAGAFMYFATLTEVPILEGLIASGMGKGPALALLLAGPALSLPNMLVIRRVMGTRRTAVFVFLVVVLSTMAGVIYGAFW